MKSLLKILTLDLLIKPIKQLKKQKIQKKLLSLYVLKYKLILLNLTEYKQKLNSLYLERIGYIYFKSSRSNLFITYCNEIQNKLVTYSLGLDKLKKKKTDFFTLKLIFKKIDLIINKYKFTKNYIIFNGFNKSLFKFYRFFSTYTYFYITYFKFKNRIAHGGCRAPKKPRK